MRFEHLTSVILLNFCFGRFGRSFVRLVCSFAFFFFSLLFFFLIFFIRILMRTFIITVRNVPYRIFIIAIIEQEEFLTSLRIAAMWRSLRMVTGL